MGSETWLSESQAYVASVFTCLTTLSAHPRTFYLDLMPCGLTSLVFNSDEFHIAFIEFLTHGHFYMSYIQSLFLLSFSLPPFLSTLWFLCPACGTDQSP